MATWIPATPVDLHCTDCGACPDEPCRTSEGRSVPPHSERTNAFDAARMTRNLSFGARFGMDPPR